MQQRPRNMGPLALELVILTACRTNEVLGMRWSEVDVAAKVLTVPKERAKTNAAHRVPLSDRALAVLTLAREALARSPTATPSCFPARSSGRPRAGPANR